MAILNTGIVAPTGGYNIERSLRFNSADSAYLNRTPASAGNRRTWTWSGWVKRSGLGATQILFIGYVDSNNKTRIDLSSTETLRVYDITGGATERIRVYSTQVFRDVSAWYHIVVAVDTTQATASNRVKVYVNGSQITAFGTADYPSQNTDTYVNATNAHEIGREISSLYLNAYLTEVNFIDGQALTPSSFGETDPNTGVWRPKKYTGTYGTNGFYLNFADNSTLVDLASDSATGSFSKRLTGGTNIGGMTGNAGLASAFNGTVETVLASTAQSSSISSGYVDANAIGKDWGVGVTKTIRAIRVYSVEFRGDLAAVGYKLQGSNNGSSWTDLATGTTPSGSNVSFYVTSGIDTSTAYRYHRFVLNGNGTNNTNVAELEFYEAGSYGINSWTPNNFSVTAGAGNDSLVDTPTPYGSDTGAGGEVRGNYATLNPLYVGGGSPTLANGNLDVSAATSKSTLATIATTSGKYYAEFTLTTAPSSGWAYVGMASDTVLYVYRSSDGNFYNNASYGAYGASYTTNDVIGVAVDIDGGKLTFYKNGVSQGEKTGLSFGANPTFIVAPTTASASGAFVANFGQRPFAYTAPSGFKALCTTNLPTPTIGATSTTQANKYFDVLLWTGNDANPRNITGLGFQPDLVWEKARVTVASSNRDHQLFDAVRGADKALSSNRTDAEDPASGYGTDGAVTAFLSDGFTAGGTSSLPAINWNGATYVAWNWKANGAGSTNTAGTITSTVSANTTAGFSIVTYTGTGANATVGHGLGVAPKMIIVKQRSAAGQNWGVYHISTGNTGGCILNGTNANNTANSGWWNNTTPTSTVFSVGGSTGTDWFTTNQSTATYVAYCFAEVAGYSAFGSYTGNGSADGPFIFTNFRPRYVLVKRTDSTGGWVIFDSSRDTYNVAAAELTANGATAEASPFSQKDFLSNGFKIRNTQADHNANGGTYVYAAFAETPFRYSLAR